MKSNQSTSQLSLNTILANHLIDFILIETMWGKTPCTNYSIAMNDPADDSLQRLTLTD